VAEFNFKQDLERALGGSPWLVGKHAVILREYDESLKPSEIRFDRMEIWARIIDLPLGWMNKHRGERAMALIGIVKKMDVDKEGKASGPYLRGRVAIEVSKPIRRGVLLKTRKDVAAEWFDVEYEKLPFFCSACGIMGHSHLDCDKPLVRNADGKLSYEAKLRVHDPKKKWLQSFSEAAAETFGSASSGNSKHSRGTASRSDDQHTTGRAGTPVRREEEEITSPMKQPEVRDKGGNDPPLVNVSTSRQLFQARKEGSTRVPRKRKSKSSNPNSSQTPDLNLPVMDTLVVIPTGLVSSRVNQLHGVEESSENAPTAASDELTKKQKRTNTQTNAGSAAAASGSVTP
jgi:hypothetical protein